MPAAAVIPAPVAYINVVAVKKLVVVVVVGAAGLALCVGAWLLWLFVWQTLVALGCRGGVVNRLL